MCSDVLWVLTACLLVDREIVFGTTCEIRWSLVHPQDSSDGPPVLLHYQALRPAAYPPLKAWSDISLFRFIGAGEG
jgi:hypothetical protein